MDDTKPTFNHFISATKVQVSVAYKNVFKTRIHKVNIILNPDDSHFNKKNLYTPIHRFQDLPADIILRIFFLSKFALSFRKHQKCSSFFKKKFLTFFFKFFFWFYKKKLSFILNNCFNFTVDQPFKKNYTIHANLLSTTNFLPKSHEFLPKFLDVLKELNKFRFDLGYLGLKKAHKATHIYIF